MNGILFLVETQITASDFLLVKKSLILRGQVSSIKDTRLMGVYFEVKHVVKLRILRCEERSIKKTRRKKSFYDCGFIRFSFYCDCPFLPRKSSERSV